MMAAQRQSYYTFSSPLQLIKREREAGMACNAMAGLELEREEQEQHQPWKMPKHSSLLHEENLIGRLDECVSDCNSDDYTTVDCTLSLSTPSTKLSSKLTPSSSSSSCLYKWIHHQDTIVTTAASTSSSPVLRYNNTTHPIFSHSAHLFNQTFHSSRVMAATAKPGRSCSETSSSSAGRKCANCDTTTTPLWRNGPKGPKSLCNACGIRFKKEERRIAGCSSSIQACESESRHGSREDDGYCKQGFNINMNMNMKMMMQRSCGEEATSSCLTWQGRCCEPYANLPKPGGVDRSFNAHTESYWRRAGETQVQAQAQSAAVSQSAAGQRPLLLLGLSVNGE